MIINRLEPILVSIGPIDIRWYGVMYVLAFLFTYWYARRRIAQDKTTVTYDQLDRLLLWLVVSMIVGARLFEVLFWQPAYYFSNPLKILAIWEGGLSFHGSLVAMTLATWWLSKKMNLRLAELADLFIVPASIGQAFGRIGNFFNHELFGKVSSLPWAVNFNNEVDSIGNLVFRHPNQLYEVGYNVIIFAILFLLRNRNLKKGTLFALWLIMYGVARFFTEFLRVGEPLVAGLTWGQWFNIVMIGAGSIVLWYLYRRK